MTAFIVWLCLRISFITLIGNLSVVPKLKTAEAVTVLEGTSKPSTTRADTKCWDALRAHSCRGGIALEYASNPWPPRPTCHGELFGTQGTLSVVVMQAGTQIYLMASTCSCLTLKWGRQEQSEYQTEVRAMGVLGFAMANALGIQSRMLCLLLFPPSGCYPSLYGIA